MKVVTVVFSPSGNTRRVAEMLESALSAKSVDVQTVDITRQEDLFRNGSFRDYLKTTVMNHDLLCLGSPVYFDHLHFNMIDAIKALPAPGNGWGSLAVPFVTYGKINSGVALPQAAKYLRKSGRTVVAGMKVNAMHSLTKLRQINFEINPGMPGDEALPLIEDLADRIVRAGKINPKDRTDVSDKLHYQRLSSRLKFAVLFRERLWQKFFLPKVVFDREKCVGCGTCVRGCPVQRLEHSGEVPVPVKGGPGCVHCGSCIGGCPEEAVDFKTNWAMWNWLLRQGAEGRGILPSGEQHESAVYPL